MNPVYGIDISKYQGAPDFERVKADGVGFVMLRIAGCSASGPYIDPQFERSYRECKRLNIPCGGYWYSCAVTLEEAERDLALLKTALRGKSFEYPLALDAEDFCLRSLSPEELTDLCLFELDTVERWGYYTALYTYSWFANHCLQMHRLTGYDWWLAEYLGSRPKLNHGMWQFGSNGQVDGIAGNVDENYAYRDYPAIIARAGLKGLPADEKQAAADLRTFIVGPASPGDAKTIRALAERLSLPLKEVC